ncbi:hypothetical protein HanRHA438_Chr05g0205321 [Helianthus annuus]|nr:hypothetical protein HanHA89_Chr05g0174431 [Helianthus annuus]KAJ0748985.1 hypothetical protein HanLR1_Chr05g0164641 [Helianthus annuus]KAJ0917377.1 hypothetical protein HanRHA438_Chr05g0205321 [Helianthus annuus]
MMVVWWWCDGDGQRGARRHCFSPVRSSGGHSHIAPERDRQTVLFIYFAKRRGLGPAYQTCGS